MLHGQCALLLMDNAADRAQVEPLIPPAGCVLLVTSRQHFVLPGLQAMNLKKLPLPDARGFLLKIAERIGGRAGEMAELCGCLPWALRLAGSVLAERVDLSPADYLRRLQDSQTRLGLIDGSLNLSYDLLEAETQRLWCMLAVFPITFDRTAAAAVWEMESDPAQDSLSELVRYSMVEWNPDIERYHLHDLARLFADACLGEDDQAAGQRCHAAHYEAVLRIADGLYEQGGESVELGLTLLDMEWLNVQAGQAWAAEHIREDSMAVQLCNAYPDAGVHCLSLRQYPSERIKWTEVALDAARRLGERVAECAHLGNLGDAYRDLGEMEQAIEYCQQSLTIAREIGDRRKEGNVMGNLGNTYRELGEVKRAIGYYEQAMNISREIGDRRGEGSYFGNLGIACRRLKMMERAIEHYKQALTIACEIGDRIMEGNVVGNLGNAYWDLGQIGQAIECYEQALTITCEIGNHRGVAFLSWNLGLLYEDSDPARATELMQVLVNYEREIGHTGAERHAARVEELRACSQG